ncbi:MAG: hypothetical protein GY851_25050 [bacterium]|nr:hypothetical protein [bacterium]
MSLLDPIKEVRPVPMVGDVVKIQAVVVIALLILLFLTVISAPDHAVLAGGLLGARGVWVVSLMIVLVAVQYCAVRGSRLCAQTGRPSSDRWAAFAYLLVFLVLVNVFVAFLRGPHAPGMVIGHDQPQYYAYLHSWVFDRDHNFENEYAAIPGITKMMHEVHPDDLGHNVAPVGTPLLWAPFYLAGHGATLALRSAGLNAPADGLSGPYAAAAAFGSLFMAWMGALLVHGTLRRWFSCGTALVVTLLVWLATPLPWYLTNEPWMSHGASFFATALVVYLWQRSDPGRSIRDWAFLGASIGLAMLVRPAHVGLLALALVDGVAALRDRRPKAALAGLSLCVLAALAVFVPQILTWWHRSGLGTPPGNPMNWTQPAVVSFLFSAYHGLFAWHPVLLFGFIGAPFLWKRSRSTTVALGLALVAAVYLRASIGSWWGGASFGMRRFIGVLPLAAPGLAAFGCWVVTVVRKRPAVPVALFSVGFVLWNILLMSQFRLMQLPAERPVSFRRVYGAAGETLHDWVGNPGSYPANLWFAARHGVSPSQFDVACAPMPHDGKIEAEGTAVRPYLGAGWDVRSAAATANAFGFVATKTTATLLIPLSAGREYDMTLDLRVPRGFDEEQFVTIRLNGHRVHSAVIEPLKNNSIAFRADHSRMIRGANEVALTFSKKGTMGTPLPYGIPVASRRAGQVTALISRVAVAPAQPEGTTQ